MLNNKTIVVTGVSSGIGAETVKILKEQGASVIGIDRNDAGGDVDQFIKADLSAPTSIDQCLAKIDTKADALCNIAGVPPTAGRVSVLTVNFLGLRYFTQAMIDKVNDGASIVNMASLAGFGWPKATETIAKFIQEGTFDNVESFCEAEGIDDARSYFFGKEVLVVWTMLNRWTWRDRGIRMNCVSPGPVDTPILQDFIDTLGERAEEDMQVMDRPGTPTDVAPLVAYLCSDQSQWMRGLNIPCDGGMSSHLHMKMHNLK